MTDFAKLSAPFDPSVVLWRVGQVTKNDKNKASALCYIDARLVMDRLDAICGPAGWQDRYEETAKGRLLCSISIKVGDDWITKSDGAGDTAVEGEKGAISDAFKRCAVKWGVGRYLYDIPIQWVKIDDWKKILPSEHVKLEKALPGSRIAEVSDAPETPPQPRQDAPLVRPAMIPVAIAKTGPGSDWKGWGSVLADRMKASTEEGDVQAWWRENATPLENCRTVAEAIYTRLEAVRDIRLAELRGGAGARLRAG